METVASVLLSVREGDFLASLDLKDAYFQIPIHPSSRKLLRFTSEGTVYQFRALCFGLSTAPQVFTRVFTAISAWAHSHRIRLLRYLDDWLILTSSEREAKQAVQSLLPLCHTLGIVINEKKSDLVPLQTAKYLCMTIDTEAGKVFLSLTRVEKFLTVAESFYTMDAPPAQIWQVVLGHLASLERLVPHGRLRMRSLQWHLKAHWSPQSHPPSLPVPLPQEVRWDLFHQGVHALNLHAWRLSSVTSESRAFREGLLESCQGVSDPPPHASTSRGSRSSVVGVVEEALLQSTPLFQ